MDPGISTEGGGGHAGPIGFLSAEGAALPCPAHAAPAPRAASRTDFRAAAHGVLRAWDQAQRGEDDLIGLMAPAVGALRAALAEDTVRMTAAPIPGRDNSDEWAPPAAAGEALPAAIEAVKARLHQLADACPVGQGAKGARYALTVAAGFVADAALRARLDAPPATEPDAASAAPVLKAMLDTALSAARRSRYPTDELLTAADHWDRIAAALPEDARCAPLATGFRGIAAQARAAAAEFRAKGGGA